MVAERRDITTYLDRLQAHLRECNRRYPQAWRQIDLLRSKREELGGWPEWCFCPLSGPYAVVSEQFGIDDFSSFVGTSAYSGVEEVDAKGLINDVARIGALSAWRVSQGIYWIDTDVLDAVMDTPMDGAIPVDILMRLPEWCCYVPTPGHAIDGVEAMGFFAFLEHDTHDGRTELRIVEAQPHACPPDLYRMSREELRRELLLSVTRTAAELVRLSWVVRLLEERGEDLTDLRLALVPTLRLIAHGQLIPEIVVRYGHSSRLLGIARSLPIPDQKRLAEGERVPMAVQRPDGSFDQQMADPAIMSGRQINQVFAAGRIRSVEEQVLLLHDRPRKPARSRRESVGRITAVSDGLIVKGTFIPKADVIAALALMAQPAQDDDEDDADSPSRRPVMVYLTDAQHERLQQAAHRGGTKMAKLVRRALVAYGLI